MYSQCSLNISINKTILFYYNLMPCKPIGVYGTIPNNIHFKEVFILKQFKIFKKVHSLQMGVYFKIIATYLSRVLHQLLPPHFKKGAPISNHQKSRQPIRQAAYDENSEGPQDKFRYPLFDQHSNQPKNQGTTGGSNYRRP